MNEKPGIWQSWGEACIALGPLILAAAVTWSVIAWWLLR